MSKFSRHKFFENPIFFAVLCRVGGHGVELPVLALVLGDRINAKRDENQRQAPVDEPKENVARCHQVDRTRHNFPVQSIS